MKRLWRDRTGSRVAALVTAATLVAAGASIVVQPVSQAEPPARAKSQRTETTQVQRVKVRWDGSKRRQTYQKTAVVPGIGDLDLICRPNKQMIRPFDSGHI